MNEIFTKENAIRCAVTAHDAIEKQIRLLEAWNEKYGNDQPEQMIENAKTISELASHLSNIASNYGRAINIEDYHIIRKIKKFFDDYEAHQASK